MKKIEKVLIHSVIHDTTYSVYSLSGCKCGIDQQAYEMAIRQKDVVLLNEVCAEPIFKEVK